MFKKALFLAVFGLLTLPGLPAGAQELKPLPELSETFDLGAYAAQTATIERSYSHLNKVAFEIALPRTWVERQTLGLDYGELTRFDGPATGEVRPYFSFRRTQVNRENSAKNEIIAYMLKSGFVLRGLKEIDDRNVEALYVVQDKEGDSYAVRTKARIQGPALLLAEYALPVDAWSNARDEQTFAIGSFRFTQESDEPIERRVDRTYHKSLSFNYPASWVFEGEGAQADNQVTITLSNPGMAGIRNGEVRLSLYSRKSLIAPEADPQEYSFDMPNILKDMKARYQAANYDIGTAIERPALDLNVKTKFAMMDVYELRVLKTEYDTQVKPPVSKELWLAVFETDEAVPRTFVIELLTPARAQDIYLWSVNTRAFEIILKSIQ